VSIAPARYALKNRVIVCSHRVRTMTAGEEAIDGVAEPRVPHGPTPSYPIESVSNALTLLLMFRDRQAIRTAEAGKALGVARSTAHRLLAMLAYYDFVTQDPVTRAYRAGPALVEVGVSVVGRMDIRSHARPHLLELRDAVQETVHLAELQGTYVLFLDSIESNRQVRVGSRVGQLMPAHVTSTGKALLAELSHDELAARYAAASLTASTPLSITTLAGLERALDEVRSRGYSVSAGESETDISAVGVAVHDRLGRAVAAISVSAPINRLDSDRAEQVAQRAREAAWRIGATLA
jgi:IclR family transcriptional regulator, acetate operon repressor